MVSFSWTHCINYMIYFTKAELVEDRTTQKLEQTWRLQMLQKTKRDEINYRILQITCTTKNVARI